MTDEEFSAAAARIVERTRAEQGLPRRVEDPETLRRVAVVVREGSRGLG